MADTDGAAGTYETRKDAGDGGPGVWRLWKQALDLATDHEKDWRKKAKAAVERYRDEKERKGARFNILYSSIQTQEPAVYNSTPKPDVRRRFNDKDPVGKLAAQAFERALSHCLDEYDFDCPMEATVHDSLLTGRGVPMVVYNPVMDGEALAYETTTVEHVQWDDFRHGPAKEWKDVPWLAVRYRITRDEAKELNPKAGATVTLDYVEPDADKERDGKNVPDIFKRLTVWKIWDKAKRETVFLAESYKEDLFAREPDQLRLKDFFPFPRPLYDISDSSSLVPLVPYEMYRDQAEELDRITKRIHSLVNVLKWRGIRPAQLVELDALKDAEDGELIPSESANSWLQAVGAMDKAIWLMPIDKLIIVIRELVEQRETVKQVVFEISGLADIMRGETDPNETLGAQQIKAQWGSMRMQRRQREVQRIARDLMRIKAEIIGEQYSAETLAAITGIQLPSPEDKIAAQAQAGMLSEQGEEVPQELQAALATPTWPEVKDVMASDALRSFRVDIESDSTIQADLTRAQQNMSQFVEGLAAFGTAMGPLVEGGAIPLDAAADILSAFARNFKLGRQAEDALDRLAEEAPQQQPKPDPEAMKAEAENRRMERELAMKEGQAAQDVQKDQAQMALEREKAQASLALEREKLQADIALKRSQLAADVSLKRATAQADIGVKREAGQQGMDLEREKLEGSADGKAAKTLQKTLADVAKAAQQAAEAAKMAVEKVRQIEADLEAPRVISVQRVNGKVTGGTIKTGGRDIPVTIQ